MKPVVPETISDSGCGPEHEVPARRFHARGCRYQEHQRRMSRQVMRGSPFSFTMRMNLLFGNGLVKV